MADPPLTEGQRWSRELLADLRAERYRPEAWAELIARSLKRARATGRERRALARQARSWGLAGVAATFLAASRGGPKRRRALAWWGLCWAMLEWHLGMVEGPAGERRLRLGPGDALTLARAGMVPFVATPAGRSSWIATVAAAAATDLADGPLARRGGETRLGRDLDACTDVAFFSAAALGAVRAGWISAGAGLTLQARHLGGLVLIAWHWFARGVPPRVVYGAARWSGAPSALGLVLGAAGRRRQAGLLLTVTSAVAAAAHAVALGHYGGRRGRADAGA